MIVVVIVSVLGVAVSDNVLVWIIILIMPICAVINPLMHSFAIIKDLLTSNKSGQTVKGNTYF